MTNINLEFYIKKFSCGTATRADKSAIKSEIMTDQQSTEELQKPDNEKEEKGNLYSSFKDIFQGVHLADMQVISKYNKGICILLQLLTIFLF